MFAESIHESVVDEHFKLFFIKHKNLVADLSATFGWCEPQTLLQVYIDEFLDAICVQFPCWVDLVTLVLVLLHVIVLERLLAARTKHFQHLEKFLNFEVNMLWWQLSLALWFGTHPNHGGSNTRLTVE